MKEEKDEKNDKSVILETQDKRGMSTFEKQVLKANKDEKNKKRNAKRSYDKAVSLVKVQILQLNGKITETEYEIINCKESLVNATFGKNFNLSTYDSCSTQLETLEDTLNDLEITLENREELLVQWA